MGCKIGKVVGRAGEVEIVKSFQIFLLLVFGQRIGFSQSLGTEALENGE